MMLHLPKKSEKPGLLHRLLALIVTAALLLGALVLVVYRDELNLDALHRWLTYRNLQTSSTGESASFTHGGGEQMNFAYLRSGLLMASAAGAHYYSFEGEQYAEQVVSLSSPVLTWSDTTGVVYDAGGRDLYLFSGVEQTFSLRLDPGADLLSARVNRSGWLAVTAQQGGHKGSVTIYSASHQEQMQINMSSTFVMDAAISPDCRTVAVVTIGQDGGVFRSTLLIYPINSKEPSHSIPLGNITVLDLEFEGDQIWALGEDRLLCVDLGQEEPAAAQYLFGSGFLKGCSLRGDGFALLMLGRYQAGSADQMVVVGPDGSVQAAQALNAQVLDFDAAGSYCSLLTADALTIYHTDLEEYARLENQRGARYTALAPTGASLLADSQQAWLYIP